MKTGRIAVMIHLFWRDLVHQLVDRLYNRTQCILIAGQDHPTGQRPGSLFIESIESQVDHLARATKPSSMRSDRFLDRLANSLCQVARKLLLQSRS